MNHNHVFILLYSHGIIFIIKTCLFMLLDYVYIFFMIFNYVVGKLYASLPMFSQLRTE